MKRPQTVLPGREYRLLGVRWYGGGPFHREDVTISTTSASVLYEVRAGDFIYNRLFAWKASFGLIPEDLDGCFVSGEFPLFQIDVSSLHPRFLYYLMVQDPVCRYIDLESSGATSVSRNRWHENRFRALSIPLPPISIQRNIADSLDRETARIDDLVARKQRLIELLEEKRIALISHAITRGLSAAAPMKDTGISWLGMMPSHWRLTPLRRLTTDVQTGPFGSQLHASDYVEGGFPVVNPANLVEGGIEPDPSMTVSEETRSALDRHILRQGDVVFGRRGELGRAAVVTSAEEGWLCGTGSIRIRFDRPVMDSRYLGSLLSTPGMKHYFVSSSIGSTMDNLNSQILLAMPLLQPPLLEQQEIAEEVHHINESSKTVLRTVRQQLKLLAEFRQALITASVTGQIDVTTEIRDARGYLPDDRRA